MSDHPFDRMKSGFRLRQATANPDNGDGGNRDVFGALQTTTKAEQRQTSGQVQPVNVNFPDHLFIPKGSRSIDIRRVLNVPTATVDFEILRFEAPPGSVTRFIAYSIFNDGSNGANYNFKPLVDGSRILPFHGDPMDNYRIYLGLGPDMSDGTMIGCELMLQPGQILQWLITNNSGVDTSMGVRMKGYFDASQKRVTGNFG
jgi:hypothetical protein